MNKLQTSSTVTRFGRSSSCGVWGWRPPQRWPGLDRGIPSDHFSGCSPTDFLPTWGCKCFPPSEERKGRKTENRWSMTDDNKNGCGYVCVHTLSDLNLIKGKYCNDSKCHINPRVWLFSSEQASQCKNNMYNTPKFLLNLLIYLAMWRFSDWFQSLLRMCAVFKKVTEG